MAKSWGLSMDENERMELERIMMDKDREAAFDFLRGAVYEKVKDSEKPGSCFHDVAKPVDDIGRPVDRHKKLGS